MENDDYILNQLIPLLDLEDKVLLECLRDELDDIDMEKYISIIISRLTTKKNIYNEFIQIEIELQLCLFLITLGKENLNLEAVEIGKRKLEEIYAIAPDIIIDKVNYFYNLGNAYSGIAELNLTNYNDTFFNENVYENFIKAKYYHTKAINLIDKVSFEYRAMILTNYAYTLFVSNRYLEAASTLNNVFKFYPTFAHAHNLMFRIILNYISLEDYLTEFLVNKQCFHLVKAIEYGENGGLQKVLLNYLKQCLQNIEINHNVKKSVLDYENDFEISTNEYNSFSEVEKFSLQKDLVLNSYSMFSRAYVSQFDSISIIDGIQLAHHEYEKFEQILNLLKSEFSHSRYLYKESLNSNPEKKHIAGTHIFELFDNIPHNYEIQAVRTSFKIAYSILDKIAYALELFINFEKDNVFVHDVSNVYFHKFMYDKKKINDYFRNSNNPYSSSLFSIFSEICYIDTEELKDKNPFGILKEIRNKLEHNFLFITDNDFKNSISEKDNLNGFDFVTLEEFNMHTLNLLQLTRCFIIYFVEFLRYEIKQKLLGSNEENEVISIPLIPK